MEQQKIANGGLQYVPQIAVQYVYLDFDGELTSYNGEILSLDNVEVQNSALTKERIANILAKLNARYVDQNVIFVTEKPKNAEYSTIFIGKTEAFSPYGNFAGLAETIDEGNQNKSDNAFVMLDSSAGDETIISTISHETDHLLGTLNHGGEGLNAYGDNSDKKVFYDYYFYNETYTGALKNHLSLSYNSIHFSSLKNNRTSDTYHYYYASASNVIIDSSGWLNVNGTTAQSIVVNNGGVLYVLEGGVASDITANSGASLIVQGGGIDDVKVNSGADLDLRNGAVANNITISAGAMISFRNKMGIYQSNWIQESGVAEITQMTYGLLTGTATNLHGSGKLVVGDRGVANGTVIKRGSVYVLSGGVANNTILNGCGNLYVSSGAQAYHTTVASVSCCIYAASGALVDDICVDSGGILSVSGNSAKADVGCVKINSGGIVSLNCMVDNAVISSGGILNNWLQIGATAASITELINNSITGIASNLCGSGSMAVLTGGAIHSTTIVSGGRVSISSGGTASDTVISSGGQLNYWSQTNSSAAYIEEMTGHSLTGLASGLNGRGSICVGSGGIAESTFLRGYNDLSAYYASMTINSGGIANNTIVDDNGRLEVSSGGKASNTVLDNRGRVSVYSCGIIDDTTVYSGSVYVLSGGVANNTILNGCGNLYVSSGAQAYHTTVASVSCCIYAASGALVDDICVDSGGILSVSGNSAKADVGCVKINSGGIVSLNCMVDNAVISSGGILNNWLQIGATAASITELINNSITGIASNLCGSGSMAVLTGGAIHSTTIVSGGRVSISSGGTASDTVISSGGQLNYWSQTNSSAAYIEEMTGHSLTGLASGLNGRGSICVGSGGIAESTFLRGYNDLSAYYASMTINSGGIANNTIVDDNGRFEVSSGGVASETVINRGGRVYISSGGVASETVISNGGYVYISSGGVASETVINRGGRVYISSGGTANSTTVNSGGSLYISSGGTAGDINIMCGGTHYLSSDTTLKGQVTLGGTMVISTEVVTSEVMSFAFALNERTGGNTTAMLNDISLLNEIHNYSVSVSTDQSNGVYKLADYASDFKENINFSINDTNNVGTLAYYEEREMYNLLSFDTKAYAISCGSNDTLTFTVKNAYVKLWDDGVLFAAAESMNKVTLTSAGDNRLDIYESGKVTSAAVNDYTCMEIHSGGTLSGTTTVSKQGNMLLHSGASLNGKIDLWGTMTIKETEFLETLNSIKASNATINVVIEDYDWLMVQPNGFISNLNALSEVSLSITLTENVIDRVYTIADNADWYQNDVYITITTENGVKVNSVFRWNEKTNTYSNIYINNKLYHLGIGNSDDPEDKSMKLTVADNMTDQVYEWLAHVVAYENISINSEISYSTSDETYYFRVENVVHDAASGLDAYGVIRQNIYGQSLGEAVILSRGTEGKIADILSDLNTLSIGNNQFKAGKETLTDWVENWKQDDGIEVVDFTGHSLGGALTQLFASHIGGRNVITFCSPGCNSGDFGKSSISGKVTHYVNNGDIVSMAGYSYLPGNASVSISYGPGSTNLQHLLDVFGYLGERHGDLEISQHRVLNMSSSDLGKLNFGYVAIKMSNGTYLFNNAYAKLALMMALGNITVANLFTSRRNVEASRDIISQIVDIFTKDQEITNADTFFIERGKAVLKKVVKNNAGKIISIAGAVLGDYVLTQGVYGLVNDYVHLRMAPNSDSIAYVYTNSYKKPSLGFNCITQEFFALEDYRAFSHQKGIFAVTGSAIFSYTVTTASASQAIHCFELPNFAVSQKFILTSIASSSGENSIGIEDVCIDDKIIFTAANDNQSWQVNYSIDHSVTKESGIIILPEEITRTSESFVFYLVDADAASEEVFVDVHTSSNKYFSTVTMSETDVQGVFIGSIQLNADDFAETDFHLFFEYDDKLNNNGEQENIQKIVCMKDYFNTDYFYGIEQAGNQLLWKHRKFETLYTLEFSSDGFSSAVSIQTTQNGVDVFADSLQMNWHLVEENIVSDSFELRNETQNNTGVICSDADGDMDVFFANANSKWESGYVAGHNGILDGWKGTREFVSLDGKNNIADVFSGSSDANVLLLTDDANGDALFVDDIYTSFGNDAARLSQIDEIRAGAGDDIIDMTSQKFAYSGSGVKIHGGLGDDTIWANCGSNTLFGDAGNDRLVGASGDDILIGGIGNDSMHGGGGDDIFCFGANFGNDTVEQLDGGSVTLWFESNSGIWNEENLTYSDGSNSVTVIGTTQVELVFGGSAPVDGGFADCASEKIFEDKNKGMLA